MKKKIISETFIIVKEEVVGIHVDGIGNLEDLRRLMFNGETFGNLKEP